ERIAQRPTEDREAARLMVLGPQPGEAHRTIADLPELVPEGSVVVVNDTRVLPARLLGTKRGTGGRAEIFLLRRLESTPDGTSAALLRRGQHLGEETWSAIGKASKGIKLGAIIDVGQLEVEVTEERQGQDALLTVRLR